SPGPNPTRSAVPRSSPNRDTSSARNGPVAVGSIRRLGTLRAAPVEARVQAELAGLPAHDLGVTPVVDQPQALAPGVDPQQVGAVPDDPGGESAEGQPAD